MILTTILGFFGGSTFRMLWGEISAWVNKAQDHKQELARMRLQGDLDKETHERNMAEARLHADLKLRIVERKGEIDIEKLDTINFGKAVDGVYKMTGFFWIDVAKSSVQVVLAYWAIYALHRHYSAANWNLDERAFALIGGILGVYVADRLLFKRGK